jgi:hypothetical protein
MRFRSTIRKRAAKFESDIADSYNRAKELESKVGAPFEKEAHYHQLSRRRARLRRNSTLPRISYNFRHHKNR